MTLQYRAAVLHSPMTPMSVETITAAELKPSDVLVRIRAAGLCHTDLEVIQGSLRYPLPIVLGHEAAGIVQQVGLSARGVKPGDHVVLSWNPHCGHSSIVISTRRSYANSTCPKGRKDGRSTANTAPG